MAKTLANRLKTILDLIIGPQQTGYIQGRFIGSNIRKLIDIIQYVENEQIAAVVISVDFEKVFDSVETVET